ncbi:orange domain-containing protein [Trichonephila clavipes]|nr:orange domain-containing protein [Trichonephila clavipes]
MAMPSPKSCGLNYTGVLDGRKNSRPPKLEKADVLELTVAYVKKMKARAVLTDDSVGGFEAGFKRCLNEVCKFLENEDHKMKSRLISHLNNSSDSYLARLALLINSNMEDTSSSCSNSSRSQTPASVSAEPCQMEYSSSSPFTDNEQEVPSNERSLSSRTFQSHHVIPVGTLQRDIGYQCSNCGGPSMSKITDPTIAPLNLATNSNSRETGQFSNESPEFVGEMFAVVFHMAFGDLGMKRCN